jgi:hypothetical protein
MNFLSICRGLGLFILALLVPGPLGFAAQFDQSHEPFGKVLKQYVKDGLVSYSALKAHRQELDDYLDQLSAVPEATFKQWTEQQQLAFLINAYNAFTLRLIIDHYPVKSIKDIGSVASGPWSQPVVRLFGTTTTLDYLEHKMLRKNYVEPRIHFAIVCAAKSCPPLRSEAYAAIRLDNQLDDQTRRFLATPSKNHADATEKILSLSPIFKWYRGDFEKTSGSVTQFLKPYWPEATRRELEKDTFKIRYLNYDWSLNDQLP